MEACRHRCSGAARLLSVVQRCALRCLFVVFFAVSVGACAPTAVTVTESLAPNSSAYPSGKAVFLAGPDSHGRGAHEHKAGSEYLAQSLQQQYPGFDTINVYGGWPEDAAVFTDADVVVLYCDGGTGHLIYKNLPAFIELLDAGVGVVVLHYAVELPRNSPSAQAMLNAVGGYFETGWSVNPHWQANFEQLPLHPVTKGLQPFKAQDEWYFNMRFQPGMTGVTPLLSAVAPLETMDRRNGAHSGNDAVRKLVAQGVPQVLAWAYEREGGGRGFAYTGGHYHSGWDNENARQLIINAIVWSSKNDIK